MSVVHTLQWDGQDIRSIILNGFEFVESLDHIVGIVYASPSIMKRIVLAMPDEVNFDYIPEGFGMLRTAYLKFKPMADDQEIRLVSHDGSVVVRIVNR